MIALEMPDDERRELVARLVLLLREAKRWQRRRVRAYARCDREIQLAIARFTRDVTVAVMHRENAERIYREGHR